MSNIKTLVRKYLLAGVSKQAGVAVAEAALVVARGGMYSCTVQAAIASKDNEPLFVEVCDKLMVDFRGNVRGIAVKYDCEQAHDKQGRLATDSDGNAVYKVPTSLQSAKSVLRSAMVHKVGLGTIAKPESFGAIRDAASIARAESEAQSATPQQKLVATAEIHLANIAKKLSGMDTASLTALNKLLAAMAKGTSAAKVATTAISTAAKAKAAKAKKAKAARAKATKSTKAAARKAA